VIFQAKPLSFEESKSCCVEWKVFYIAIFVVNTPMLIKVTSPTGYDAVYVGKKLPQFRWSFLLSVLRAVYI
jgi:hypothetical protein